MFKMWTSEEKPERERKSTNNLFKVNTVPSLFYRVVSTSAIVFIIVFNVRLHVYKYVKQLKRLQIIY